MTRAERFAHQEARAKVRLETQRKQLAHVQAQRRQAEQKDRAQRWLRVGQLVEAREYHRNRKLRVPRTL
jgi:hypothetical protein